MRHFRRLPEEILRLLAALVVGCLACGIAQAQEFDFEESSHLNTDAETDEADDNGGDMETDGTGRWISVWSRRQPSESAEIVFTLSDDDGVEWSEPVAIDADEPDGDDGAPTLANDGQDSWMAAWHTYRNQIHDDEGTTITLGGRWRSPVLPLG